MSAQPTITISFDDQAAYDEMVEAVALADGYQELVPDPDNPESGVMPNPQSKDEFMLYRVGSFLGSKKQAVADEQHASSAPDVDYGFAGGTTPAGPVGRDELP